MSTASSLQHFARTRLDCHPTVHPAFVQRSSLPNFKQDAVLRPIFSNLCRLRLIGLIISTGSIPAFSERRGERSIYITAVAGGDCKHRASSSLVVAYIFLLFHYLGFIFPSIRLALPLSVKKGDESLASRARPRETRSRTRRRRVSDLSKLYTFLCLSCGRRVRYVRILHIVLVLFGLSFAFSFSFISTSFFSSSPLLCLPACLTVAFAPFCWFGPILQTPLLQYAARRNYSTHEETTQCRQSMGWVLFCCALDAMLYIELLIPTIFYLTAPSNS